jgi:hypothetical protein
MANDAKPSSDNSMKKNEVFTLLEGAMTLAVAQNVLKFIAGANITPALAPKLAPAPQVAPQLKASVVSPSVPTFNPPSPSRGRN